ncbi:TetR/AcrR family transcriptional regulator [Anaerocolumna xylanovorans]|uniref:Transcriptional regulator, TetR family n=1 Tax=Anaerocolumna xylanovorans DSM 12503 TaxID=1121345 RepID=A0A1M7YK61_9FIRM|nr:TetR/AcrR family transcriptional regulator [Anaerocolumna xylanovorans]SHO53015.1 transcriptional regulator, TetR family [Anaerocolumna xylanovorans DSM 12503]
MDKKAEIYRCGKHLFSLKGFKDTNVAEIMKMAGMAAGTFYNYYPSKETLFLDIYNEENVILKKSIMESLDVNADPMHTMQQMMLLNYQGMNSNPILREWYNRDVFNKIEKSFCEEKGLKNVDFLYSNFIEIVREWQAAGRMRSDIDAELIMAMFTALIVAETHKDEIGIQYFPHLIEYLAEFTMKGLLDCPARTLNEEEDDL